MAALTAASFTVVISEKRHVGKNRITRGTLAFGDGTSTYSTGGIPLPVIAFFGMQLNLRNLKLNIGGVAATSKYLFAYVASSNKLQLFVETTVATDQPLIEASSAAAPAAMTLDFEAVGW